MKELKRIDWSIVQKIITFLYYNEKVTKSSIALNCKMNYNRCSCYLDWMNKMELVRQEDDDSRLIRLTDRGTKICE